MNSSQNPSRNAPRPRPAESAENLPSPASSPTGAAGFYRKDIEEIFVAVPGGRLFTLQWGSGPLLVFTHATGLCARAYLGLLGPLGRSFRVVAYDARGHGRTELEADPAQIPTDWRIFRDDLAHLVRALGEGQARLAGHSFGGSVSLETAAEHPGLASSVLLIDPPSVPFAQVAEVRAMRAAGQPPAGLLAQQAERRRAHFESRAEIRAAYHQRGAFRGWPEQALDDYLDGGLVDDGNGVRLACAPAFEAACYRGITSTLADSFAKPLPPPTLLLAGEQSMVPPDMETLLRERCPTMAAHRFPGAGHFLAITHADLLRPYLAAMP